MSKKTKSARKDKRITKIYKAFLSVTKDLYDLSDQRMYKGVCRTAKDMQEKRISDNLNEAKIAMFDVLSALGKAEEINEKSTMLNETI